jgi:uncharacterized protein DUF6924
MKPLPASGDAIVLRTSFSDPATWALVRAAIAAPVDGFVAYVQFVDDAAYANITKEQVMALFRDRDNAGFVIVADDATMTMAEHPLLVIDLGAEPGREFRAIPRAVQTIENNLSITNLDFAEFAEAVDADGVFRGA